MPILRYVAANVDQGPLTGIARAACNAGFELAVSPTPAALRGDLMREGPRPEVVALEAADAAADDFALLRALKRWDPLVEVLLVAPQADETLAVEAVRQGALDVLVPPLEPRAQVVLEKVRADRERRRLALELEIRAGETYRFQGMVGRNPLMLDVFSLLARVAPHFSAVLLTGEPGTGKELAARALHDLSPRAGGPFVTCNCAALAGPALESRLFGRRSADPAGAARGLFEAASGGTAFLDDVADLGPALQAGLLEVLDRQQVVPAGAARPVPVDVRVVAATRHDLRAMAREGRFRADLLRRLDALEVRLPPLRARKDDLPLLVRALLPGIAAAAGKEIRGLSREAQTRLLAYDWPGNVRELIHVLRRAAGLVSGTFIGVLDLPAEVQAAGAAGAPAAVQGGRPGRPPGNGGSHPADFPTLAEVERRHIERAVAQTDGNHARAAALLGLSRQALYRKLAKHGLARPAPLPPAAAAADPEAR